MGMDLDELQREHQQLAAQAHDVRVYL